MKVKEDVWTGGVREDNILYVLNNKLRAFLTMLGIDLIAEPRS